jgi:phosphatidylglycerophosphate synthase
MQRRRTADLITTVRMVLVSLAALWEAAGAAAVFEGGHMLLGPAFLVAAAALTDYVDGVIARRSGPSEGGARWDMETDAYVMFALSLMVVLSRGLPVWVLFIGALRYLFVFPFALLPQLPAGAGGPVFKLLAKTACAVAVVTLLTGLVPAMAGGAAAVLNAAALGALLLSFGWETAIRLRVRYSQVRRT